MARTRTHYIRADEFREALLDSQAEGQPTEHVCRLFRLLISRYLSGPRYAGYDREIRNDLATDALIKCIRNIKNFNPERKASPFSYYTMAIECACKDYLSKHYRHSNLKRELCELSPVEWEGSMPVQAAKVSTKKQLEAPLAAETQGKLRNPEGRTGAKSHGITE